MSMTSLSYANAEKQHTLDLKESTNLSERVLQILNGHTSVVQSVAYSPDGKFIASGSTDKTIRVWNSATGLEAMEPLTGTGQVCLVSFSPDGKYILSAFDNNTICIWDANTGQMTGSSLIGHTNGVYCAAYSPDGRNIVSGSHDETIRIWDLETRKTILGPLEGHSGAIRSVAYSPDGMHVISGSDDQTIRKWDVKTGQNILDPIVHPFYVTSVAYSPDGKYIASGCMDDNIYIWNSETGTQTIEPLKGHSDVVNCVSFSPNGKYLSSCSVDKTVRIWDVETGKEAISAFKGHKDAVFSVAYSPDGQYIISGANDKTAVIWDAQIPDNEQWFLNQDASKAPQLGAEKLNKSTISLSSNSSEYCANGQENILSYELSGAGDLIEEMTSKSFIEGEQAAQLKKKTATTEISEVISSGESAIGMNEIYSTQYRQQGLKGNPEPSAPARSNYHEMNIGNNHDSSDSDSEEHGLKANIWKQLCCCFCWL